MILQELIWDFKTIMLVIGFVVFGIFWTIVMFRLWDFGMGDVKDDDDDLPDEITIEIVKESPAKPSTVQTEPSSLPSSAEEQSYDSSFRPTGKGGYFPE